MNQETELHSKILNKWKELKTISSNLGFFISRLETTSNNGIGIFGGAVRDWWLDKSPKDIDIVIDTSYFNDIISGFYTSSPNEFGGYVFEIDGITFDVWNFEDSYAFKHGGFNSSWQSLVKSVPFNIDSVIVMVNDKTVYEHGFWKALEDKEIDFVNSVHRDPKFIAQRALKFRNKYGFNLSPTVSAYTGQHLSLEEMNNLSVDKYQSSNLLPKMYLKPVNIFKF